PTQIHLTVPTTPITRKIIVATAYGTAVSADAHDVVQPPKVTSFSPASGPVGAAVTITGANLTGTAVVTFGGNVSTSPTSVSATQVKTSVPDGAMTGQLRVTNDAGTATSVGVFRVSPKITGFSP